MEKIDDSIVITDENGKKHNGKILFSFEANGDEFVVYELLDNAHAAKIDDDGSLIPIEEDEWKLVEKIYNEFIEDTDEDLDREEESE